MPWPEKTQEYSIDDHDECPQFRSENDSEGVHETIAGIGIGSVVLGKYLSSATEKLGLLERPIEIAGAVYEYTGWSAFAVGCLGAIWQRFRNRT